VHGGVGTELPGVHPAKTLVLGVGDGGEVSRHLEAVGEDDVVGAAVARAEDGIGVEVVVGAHQRRLREGKGRAQFPGGEAGEGGGKGFALAHAPAGHEPVAGGRPVLTPTDQKTPVRASHQEIDRDQRRGGDDGAKNRVRKVAHGAGRKPVGRGKSTAKIVPGPCASFSPDTGTAALQ
jgi:hypothetical protein